MDYEFKEEDYKILDALVEIYNAMYRYYLLQINVDDNCLISNKEILVQLKKKEQELLAKLNLDYPKTNAILDLLKKRIVGEYEETDVIVGVFDDNPTNMAYKRLINSTYNYYTLTSIKELFEYYKDFSRRRAMLDEDTPIDDNFHDDFFDESDEFSSEDFLEYQEESDEDVKDRLRRVLEVENYAYNKDAIISLSYLVNDDSLKYLEILIDEEINKNTDKKIIDMLNRAKFNIMFLNPSIEDDYLNEKGAIFNSSYLYAKALHIDDSEYNDLKNRCGVAICGVELENLFYFVETEYSDFNTRMTALLRGINLRVGNMFLDDKTLKDVDEFVKKSLMLYEEKDFSEELEEEILSDINEKIELTVMGLARKDISASGAVNLVKDSIIHSNDDRKRFRTI